MPLDLDAYQLDGAPRFRMALFQELLDHCDSPKEALVIAQEAEGWIVGEIAVAQMLSPDMLIDIVRPLVAEMVMQHSAETVGSSERALPSFLAPDATSGGAEEIDAPPDAKLDVIDAPTLPRSDLKKATSGPAPEASNMLRRHDATIRDMAAAGSSYEDIAAETRLSSGYVRMRAKELGIKIHKPGPPKGTLCRPPLPEPATAEQDAPGLVGKQLAALQSLKASFPTDVFTAADLKKIYGGAQTSANTLLAELSRLGHIERVGFGRYKMAGAKGFDPKSDQARSEVESFIAQHGVSTQPDFGYTEINKLYPEIRARSHSLNMTSNKKHFLADGYKQMGYAECLKWMQDIVKNERPTVDLDRPPAEQKGAAE